MKTANEKGGHGNTFEDFLKEQGTLEETNAVAIKRVAAWQTKKQIKDLRILRSTPPAKERQI